MRIRKMEQANYRGKQTRIAVAWRHMELQRCKLEQLLESARLKTSTSLPEGHRVKLSAQPAHGAGSKMNEETSFFILSTLLSS